MKKRILIVEDEERQRSIIAKALIQRGYDVSMAFDGIRGLQLALSRHPDAILTDVRMPNMDGMTMIHKLRADDWGSKVPIIILTNYDNTDAQLDQILLDNPSYFLLKVNSSIDDIVDKIELITEPAA